MHGVKGFAKHLPGFIKREIKVAAFRALNLRWRLRSGLQIEVSSHSDWIIFNEIFVNGDYDAPILMAFERAPEHAELKILDLGANVGFFALRCIDLLRRHHLQNLSMSITTLEGNPKTHRTWLARLSAQDDMPSVNAINGLVGHRIGSGMITDFEFCGNNRVAASGDERSLAVNYVDLEQVLGTPSRIDLLKCDIEGGELLFLQNYPDLLRRTEVAVFELHDNQCDTQECVRLLRDVGFEHIRNLAREGPLSLVHVWR